MKALLQTGFRKNPSASPSSKAGYIRLRRYDEEPCGWDPHPLQGTACEAPFWTATAPERSERLKHLSSRWWQLKDFFFFHPNLGKISILTTIFQRGLKPPTSLLCFSLSLLTSLKPKIRGKTVFPTITFSESMFNFKGVTTTISFYRWWFQICFFSPLLLGRFPLWQICFWMGLKPPTSQRFPRKTRRTKTGVYVQILCSVSLISLQIYIYIYGHNHTN